MPDITIKTMYNLAPLIKLPETIDLPATSGPNSMYRLEPFVQVGGLSSHLAVSNGVLNGGDSNSNEVVQQLSARQEVVMQKLQRLQQQLDQMKAKRNQDRKKVSASVSTVVTDVPQFQNTATAATTTPAVLEQQHHAVLHKLLLLQHRLSNVLLKQPGCPTWPPPGSEAGVCHDLVISASPLSPPYSVLAMAASLRAVGYTVLTTAAVHSSIDPNTVPLVLSSEFSSRSSSSTGNSSRGDHQVVLSFVWSAVPHVTLMVNPLAQCSISGEGNVLRYLSRLLPASSPYHYEADASFAAIARTDLALDDCTTLLAAAPTDKRAIGQFVKRVDEAVKKTSSGVAEPVFGAVGDVAVWSVLRQLQERGTKLPPASLKWLNTVANTIVAGLFVGSRVRDAPSQPPLASASLAHSCEDQENAVIRGIGNSTALGGEDMSSFNRDDHNFSDGFWSNSRPIVSENCNDVHNFEDDCDERASYSDRQVIDNVIPSKQEICEANLPISKSELITENNSLPSGSQDHAPVLTDASLLPHPVVAHPHPLGSDGIDGHVQYKGLVARMDQLGIHYQLRHHASVMTVDQLMENVGDMPGLHMKNLFLRDKKKKTLYLVCARHNAKVQLNKVGKQVGCRELRFTDRNVLYSVLGVQPGHVTAYALINDVRNVVTLVLDDAVTYDKQQMVNFHPLVNTATLGMSSRDLLSFIEFTGHKPLFMKFEDD